MSVNWRYYNKFDRSMDTYLPSHGEGDSLATQIVTAITKLVYKYYNDGDVFDNTGYLEGWANDLSSYANWLAKYVPGAKRILSRVYKCGTEDEYEDLLRDLADAYLDMEDLERYATQPTQGSIYDCKGPFHFVDRNEEEEWEDEYDDDDYPYESAGDEYDEEEYLY